LSIEEENGEEVEVQSDSVFTTEALSISLAIFVATVAVFYFAYNRTDSN
jgi:hypothetical protein